MTEGPRPTLAKVAAVAGVSRSTASNVLAGRGRVSQETAHRVRDVATQLGYRADAGARALRAGASPVVGLVMDIDLIHMDSDTPALWWPRVLFSCMERLSERGHVVAVLPTGALQRSPSMRLDAVVGVERADGTPGLPAGLPYGLPVFYGGPGAPPGCAQVVPDFRAIVADVMEHLTARGAQRVGLVAPSVQISAPELIRQAFSDWHVSRGRPVGPVMVGHDVGGQVAEAVRHGCDAVFSTTNQSAALLHELQARHVRVPQDIRLVTMAEGVLERLLAPTVTVVSLCGSDNGRELADAIVAAVESGRPTDVLVRHRLIPGGSTD